MRPTEREGPAEILLVEDDPAEVRLIEEAFKEGRTPVRLHVAQNGDTALAFLRPNRPSAAAVRADLILLSLKLPGMDGLGLLAELNSDPALRLIPAIVLTNSHARPHITRCYKLGANSYLVKPLGLDDFFGLIRAIEGFWLTVATLPF